MQNPPQIWKPHVRASKRISVDEHISDSELPKRPSLTGRLGSDQETTRMSFSTEVAPGADQAVAPARSRALKVVISPVRVIAPPCALTLIVFGS